MSSEITKSRTGVWTTHSISQRSITRYSSRQVLRAVSRFYAKILCTRSSIGRAEMTTDNRWGCLAGKYWGKEEIERCVATRKMSEMRNGGRLPSGLISATPCQQYHLAIGSPLNTKKGGFHYCSESPIWHEEREREREKGENTGYECLVSRPR